MLIASSLAEHQPQLSQGRMTQIKAALVKANTLGFLCLDFSYSKSAIDIQQDAAGGFREIPTMQQLHIWKFMRHHSREITAAQKALSKTL
jgi:dsRNA-specific ribonuclease